MITKATTAEKTAYAATKAIYPLYGWVTVPDVDGNKHRLAVEDLRGSWTRPDPIYEVIAPRGMWFKYEYTHSLLAHDLKDVSSRLKGLKLEKDESNDGINFD